VYGGICPNIKSEAQGKAIISALKQSFESKQLADAATKYLRGVKGMLVQQKEQNKENEATNANGGVNDVKSVSHVWLHKRRKEWHEEKENLVPRLV
jgi:Chromatin remodeling factor Mit1 C-terminal Zn finger 2